MRSALFACLALTALLTSSAMAQTPSSKDQSILEKDPTYSAGGEISGAPATGGTGGQNIAIAPTDPTASGGGEQGSGDDVALTLADIPVVQTVELTPQTALKALDVYDIVLKKYQGGDMAEYENVQAFVDKGKDGKAFEADVRAAGFANAAAWDAALNAVSFAFLALNDNPGMEVLAQIKEINADTKMSQEVKERWISSLRASVPSQNNLNIVREMVKDPLLLERLQLMTEEDQGVE